MTADGCDSLEVIQTTAAEMLDSNVSTKMLREDNVTKNSSCSSVSVGYPITMMITGMVGNSLALILVCISYRKKENKRKKSFLLCIGSLALTDLFGQLVTSPIVISVYRAGMNWDRIDQSGALCHFFGVCMTTFGLCPLFLASAMAIERAIAITNPHWYSNHMKTSVTKKTLAFIWLLVLLFALLPIAGVGKYTRQWPGTWCFISTGDREVKGNMFFAVTFAVLGILSLLLTLSCNVLTIRGLIIRCKTKSGTSQTSRQWERLTTETVIQLLGIMCVLLICWSPLLMLMLRMISTQVSSSACSSTHTPGHLDCDFFLMAIRLASLNQILDPWVYLLLREILLRKFCLMANAVSNCSTDDHKEIQTALAQEVPGEKQPS
ncbi:prostaglandin E2 receptor EP3 subtype [Lates calcarifer]|uniref:Prostaglandin E2 receptor EP3 subtype n=1 Tax=Lates calcarifer TaxID=8187 RepID=A0A4W6DU29_LATCA|nr:prostaglandin E2 receptor EP3 subtype [Lates calcarifer]